MTIQEEEDLKDAVRKRNEEIADLKQRLVNSEQKNEYIKELKEKLKIKNDEKLKSDVLLRESDVKCQKLIQENTELQEDKEKILEQLQQKKHEIEMLISERYLF